MPTRNVVLTEQQVAMIERLVGSGRYQNASEVLRDGLRLIGIRDAREAIELEARRAQLRLESAAKLGETIPLQSLIVEARLARQRMTPVMLDDILAWRDEGRA